MLLFTMSFIYFQMIWNKERKSLTHLHCTVNVCVRSYIEWLSWTNDSVYQQVVNIPAGRYHCMPWNQSEIYTVEFTFLFLWIFSFLFVETKRSVVVVAGLQAKRYTMSVYSFIMLESRSMLLEKLWHSTLSLFMSTKFCESFAILSVEN